jgi:lipid-binding SYLF domain-containing protein
MGWTFSSGIIVRYVRIARRPKRSEGRDASAQTDAVLHAEMLSYSRSRGLFAGISLEGATLRPDEETNRELYGRDACVRPRSCRKGRFL